MVRYRDAEHTMARTCKQRGGFEAYETKKDICAENQQFLGRIMGTIGLEDLTLTGYVESKRETASGQPKELDGKA